MALDDKQIGLVVPGTSLRYLAPVPRKSPHDRNAMGLFECVVEGCGKQKEIRVANVKPGHTTSCGCVGKELYKEYVQKRASNHISPNAIPKSSEEEIIDPQMRAAFAKELAIFELWEKMYPGRPGRVPWFKEQMETVPGWTGGWMTPEESLLVLSYLEIISRRWETIELELESEERKERLYARDHGGFRSEKQRLAWLRSEDPRDRLEAEAAGTGESAKIAAAELKHLREKEGHSTNEMLQDVNCDFEIG